MSGQVQEVSISINLVVGLSGTLQVKQATATIRFYDGESLEKEIERVTSGISQMVGATIRNEVAMQTR